MKFSKNFCVVLASLLSIGGSHFVRGADSGTVVGLFPWWDPAASGRMTNVVSVSVGPSGIYGIREDGTVASEPRNAIVESLTNVAQIFVGISTRFEWRSGKTAL